MLGQHSTNIRAMLPCLLESYGERGGTGIYKIGDAIIAVSELSRMTAPSHRDPDIATNNRLIQMLKKCNTSGSRHTALIRISFANYSVSHYQEVMFCPIPFTSSVDSELLIMQTVAIMGLTCVD